MNAKQAIRAELREVEDRRKKRRLDYEAADKRDAARAGALRSALDTLSPNSSNGHKPKYKHTRPRRSREEMRRMVEDYLREHGPTPQVELRRALDLSTGSMSYVFRNWSAVERAPMVRNGSATHEVKLARETVIHAGEGVREGRRVA